MNSVYFGLFMLLIFSQVGRKVGWTLSKKFVYGFHITLQRALAFAFVWCIGIFVLDLILIKLFQPHWAVKWALGYALGAYVSSPNFGLVAVSTIPTEYEKQKNDMVQHLPQALFLLMAVAYEIVMNFIVKQ